MFYIEHAPTREEINRERYHEEIREAIDESMNHGELPDDGLEAQWQEDQAELLKEWAEGVDDEMYRNMK